VGLRAAVEAAGHRALCEVAVFSAQHWRERDPASVLDIVAACFRTFR
jgi:hypothetical protein